MLFVQDAGPYIHSSLYLQVMNGEVESCEEKRRSGEKVNKMFAWDES